MAETQELEGKNTLSTDGKEVLIKAVIQVILSYVMSCFQLLVGLCRKTKSMISRFQSGQKSEKYRIHWVSWSYLCSSKKKKGGLGFRDLYSFNLVIFPKQH